MHHRLYDFLRKQNILYNYQFGFRKGHSTLLALIELTDFTHAVANTKLLLVYFDITKAFHTDDHDTSL